MTRGTEGSNPGARAGRAASRGALIRWPRMRGGRDMLATIIRIYDFRNTRVAHQEKDITDPKEAQQNLVGWITGLKALTEAS